MNTCKACLNDCFERFLVRFISGRDLSQRKSSAQRYDSPQQYQSVVQNNDTDDDDDDDVVIGSSSSLNSDSRFEQSYLSKYKTGSSQNVRKSQMSRIQEEEHGLGNVSWYSGKFGL